MDRRTAAGVFVLALAALVVIAAWLLRAEGPPAPVVPAPIAEAPRATAPRTVPSRAALPAPAVAAPAASVPAPPSAEAPAPRADRLVTPEEKALRKWGPKGRVVEAGTGKPLAWKSVVIQVRRPDNPAAVEIRGTDRGATPEGDPEALSAFDLARAELIQGDGTLAGAAPGSMEYRVVVQAWGHRRAVTEWRPLPEGPRSPEATIALETDPLSTLSAVVRNQDGTPFRGMVIANLGDADGEYENVISATTDESGRARLPSIPSGEFEVRLRAVLDGGGPPVWQPVQTLTDARQVRLPPGGTADAEFTVPATGEIQIAWIDSGGAALRGAYTEVEHVAGYSTQVDRMVGLPPGQVSLVLRVTGCRTWKSTVQVVAGQVTKVEARFEPGEDPR